MLIKNKISKYSNNNRKLMIDHKNEGRSFVSAGASTGIR